MIRLLYMGDWHNSESAPMYRTDEFLATKKQKLQEIKDYVNTHKVHAILEGGDFFDKSRISAEALAEIYIDWEKVIGIAPSIFSQTPILGIEGNHELIGAQIGSYDRTSLHVLEASGFLKIVSKYNPFIITDESGFTVAITGSPYNRNSDKTDDKSDYLIDEKLGDVHIHLTHGMIMNKSFGSKFDHTTIHELAPHTKADLTINGHDHIGFPSEQIDGKWFANPGAPMRLKAENNEINRMPKFLVIEIHDDLSIHLEDVYFKCAKAGSEILTAEHIKMKKDKLNHMAQLQALVNQAETKQGLHIADIIDNIGNTQGIDKKILTEAKEEIVDVMNSMAQKDAYKPIGDYYITRVELENFLSHKYSVFDFTNGLNILAGDSRSGKQLVI